MSGGFKYNGDTNDDSPQNSNAAGGYGGYGSGGSGPTPQQQTGWNNLGGVTGWNMQSELLSPQQADKIYQASLDSNKNFQKLRTDQNKQNIGNDWYTQQQKLQSVASHLADTSGNAMYGSFYNDINDAIARYDDMSDTASLNQMRQNQNEIDNDFNEALMSINNSRNEMYMDTEQNLRELAADYVAQGNNIHPDLVQGYIDTEGHTLNPPDWLQTKYFDEHFIPAAEFETQPLYRPENAAALADQARLVNKETNSMFKDSGNMDYWSRMRKGYQRRTQ